MLAIRFMELSASNALPRFALHALTPLVPLSPATVRVAFFQLVRSATVFSATRDPQDVTVVVQATLLQHPSPVLCPHATSPTASPVPLVSVPTASLGILSQRIN